MIVAMNIDTAADLQPHADQTFAELGFLDVDHSEQINLFMEMVIKVSKAEQPSEVMKAFSHAMWKTMGDVGLITLTCKGLKPGQYKITRRIGLDGVNQAETDDPWGKREELPTVTGGFLGKLISTPTPKLCHHMNVPDDPILGDFLSPFGSLTAVPAFIDGVAMNWAIMFRKEPEGFSIEDLRESILRANLIGAMVNNVIVHKELRRLNEQMEREVERIANIQRALLPKHLPEISKLEIAASYNTYDRAGGDVYDFVCLKDPPTERTVDPNARWAILVADVSGHGPSAAVVMAMLNAILYAYPHMPEGPAELLTFANRHLCAKRIDENFVTAFMAFFDPNDLTLTYSRAGHPPALLKSPDAPLRQLDEGGGLPLGVVDDADYEEHTITLKPLQTLVLYTDGIAESLNPNDKMFGIPGIEKSLVDCSGEPDCVVGSIMQALRDHEGGVRPSDDQTIVAMQVTY